MIATAAPYRQHRHMRVDLRSQPQGHELQLPYQYLRGFKPPFGDGYDVLVGTAILRLSQYLTPARARAYKAAFR